MKQIVLKLEKFLFFYRTPIIIILLFVTLVMGYFGMQLRMEAGFEKQMPIGHEYITTFKQYREQLFGANRLTVVVKARHGTIWNKKALTRLYEVTQAVTFLPNVERLGVQSLWTPNSYVNEITEEGFLAEPIIPGTITVDGLTPDIISHIERATSQGGYVGTLVSRDQTSAMITADISEYNERDEKLNYVSYNDLLEKNLRTAFEDRDFEIQIIGFAKQIGDIAKGASAVFAFCGIAILLTALAVFWFCRSWRLTALPILCSLTSLVWQFGTLRLIGYGLDPLAVLVPFLVFAIGVSHGVQQINFILRRLAQGRTTDQAARDSFSGLLIPGALALVTALISFVTLMLIPIPMIRELAITASLGVGFKIITNLVMLPLAVSFFKFSQTFAEQAMRRHTQRSKIIKLIAVVVQPRNAVIITFLSFVLLGVSIWEGRDRIVGTLQPGAPELRVDSRFNRDAVSIARSYDIGLDWLTVVFQSPAHSCSDVAIGKYQDDFVWRMQHVRGVQTIKSFSGQMRIYSQGYNEGSPKMSVVPLDQGNYAGLATEIARNRGYVNGDCSMTAVHLFLTDHKAVTIKRVIDAVTAYRKDNVSPSVTIRLASGNAGVLAAINNVLETTETPMLMYVYMTIILLVLLVYRDFRAAIACCLPLTIATFVGYWFMKEFDIGLTVATLPVMVLAVGIGVDYALYIYNRLQMHMADGDTIVVAMERALEFEGMATIFTALTLALGVATWSFSELKFQADMGMLLAFMFIVNLIMAFTALPALAVVLERIFPRSKPAYAPSILTH